jgi:hypothetical protein
MDEGMMAESVRIAAGVHGELYFAFAENDRSATPEVADQFRHELEPSQVRVVVERLPGPAH